ncbi:MAG TPA: adenylate/guanylate cyclase domain-containing protein [Anaerolineae bacterium]|nr:adenylate/guanylate cyclase domain-containing protein [Anaerolineae bacterium]
MNPLISLRAYIPMDRRQALVQKQDLPPQSTGAALFADISGFTPLTTALAEEFGRKRGAEETLNYINPIYEALIDILHNHGGSVIGFAGDAITCWLDDNPNIPYDGYPIPSGTQRALTCALAMQAIMHQFSNLKTPSGNAVPMGIKIGIAAGPVTRYLVGNQSIQLIDTMGGSTLARMTEAEHFAQNGDIVVSQEVVDQLPPETIRITHWHQNPATQQRFAVISGLNIVTYPTPWEYLASDALDADTIKPWVLPSIFERLNVSHALLGELRPVVPLFLRFNGLDYDNDPDVGQKLNAYISWAQLVINQYDGDLIQLTIGDKGSFFYAAFGAIITYHDITERAATAALELLNIPDHLNFITSVQIGISQGQVWTGACGAVDRHTFGVMGNQVNMSARLMGKAAHNQILIHENVARIIERQFQLNYLEPIMVKGRSTPLPVAELMDYLASPEHQLLVMLDRPLVGREKLLENWQETLAIAQSGQGQIWQLYGGTGIGKSHLTAVLNNLAHQYNFTTTVGFCQSTTQDTAYYPWRQILSELLQLNTIKQANPKDQTEHLLQYLENNNPDWLLRAPLLAQLLAIPLPENDASKIMDPKTRQSSLIALVIDIILYHANKNPLLIIIEDNHWIDEASNDLTQAIARATLHTPLILTLVQRPDGRHTTALSPITTMPNYQHHNLTLLAEPEIARVLENELGGPPTRLLTTLVTTFTQGNPLFVHELLTALRENNQIHFIDDQNRWGITPDILNQLKQAQAIIKEDDVWVVKDGQRLQTLSLNIPDSVQKVVLARIDRLSEQHKATLKVASVIGRRFELPLLHHAHPQQLNSEIVEQHLQMMQNKEFIHYLTTQTYLFQHNTTHEVVYDSLLYAQRKQFHTLVAQWYEQQYGIPPANQPFDRDFPLAPYYALLVHHWHFAENKDKEKLYAHLAGQQASNQYANEEAIFYFNRALDLTPTKDIQTRYQLLLDLITVYEAENNQEEAEKALKKALQYAYQIGSAQTIAEAYWRQAEYYRIIRSDIQKAEKVLQNTFHYNHENTELIAKSYLTLGIILMKQGEYPEAREKFQKGLDLADKAQAAKVKGAILTQLGNVNFYDTKYDQARHAYEQAATICAQIDDRRELAASLMMQGVVDTNTGHYLSGQEKFQEALNTFRSIGYRLGEVFVSINLGTNYEFVGEYIGAKELAESAIRQCELLGHDELKSIAYTNLTLILFLLGDDDALIPTAQTALQIQRARNDQRREAYTLTNLGRSYSRRQQWDKALDAYQTAYDIRKSLGEKALMIDDLAGLALIYDATNQPQKAFDAAQECLQWINENGLRGIEYPSAVYISVFHIFMRNNLQTEAQQIITDAYNYINEQMNRIKSDELRHKYLNNVPFNRVINDLYHNQSFLTNNKD